MTEAVLRLCARNNPRSARPYLSLLGVPLPRLSFLQPYSRLPSHVSQSPDRNVSHRYPLARDANVNDQTGDIPHPTQPQPDCTSHSPSTTSRAGGDSADTRDVESDTRDPSCTQSIDKSSTTHIAPMNTESAIPPHPPTSVEGTASNLTSPETPYLLARYVEDQKLAFPNLDTSTPDTFAPNHSLSPLHPPLLAPPAR